jgi:hypothetical protein
MKKDKEIVSKLKETIDLLGEDKREELLNYLSPKSQKTNKKKFEDILVVYKCNVETEKMLAVGQAFHNYEKNTYLITVFPSPEKNSTKGLPSRDYSLPSLKNAKAYYNEWFIEDSQGGFMEIYPSNRILEIYIPNEFDDFPIGVISEQLSVTLYSSYEKLINKNHA